MQMAPHHRDCLLVTAFIILFAVTTAPEDRCLCQFDEYNCSRIFENDAVYYVTAHLFLMSGFHNMTYEPYGIVSSGIVRCWSSTFQPKHLIIKKCRRGDTIRFNQLPERISPVSTADSAIMVCVNRNENKLGNYSSNGVLKLVNQYSQLWKLWMISVKGVWMNLNHSIFRKLTSVKILKLNELHLDHIPVLMLQNANELQGASFSYNELREVRSQSFIYQKRLKTLHLNFNKLRCLGICTLHENDNFMKYLEELVELHVTHNRISKICPNVFQFTPYLTTVWLQGNEISTLNGVFVSDKNRIIDLRLSTNKIEYITNGDFVFLTQLEILDLSHNHIKFIDEFAFKNFRHPNALEGLNLDNNFLQSTEFLEHFSEHFFHITIRNNNIQHFPKSIKKNTELLLVGQLDLSGNHISYLAVNDILSVNCGIINLANNEIKIFDLHAISTLINKCHFTVINLNGNPLTCDCSAKSLLKHVTSGNVTTLNIYAENLYCNQPKSLRNMLFKRVDAKFLHCEEERNCPLNCTCQYTNMETTVDCSNGNLKIIPIVIPRNATLLTMNYNALTSLKNLHEWNSLQSLNLEHCLTLGTLEASDIVDLNQLKNLTMLSLQYNDLTALPEYVFENLTKLSVLMLGYNKLIGLPLNAISSLNHLSQLFINNNELETLSDAMFEKNSDLQIINACYNQLSSIKLNISNLNDLRSVDLSNNKLTNIDIQWPTKVTTILLSGNFIESLNLENFPQNLHILDLHSNSFKYLNLTKFDHFDHSSSVFDFSNNVIKHISEVNFDKTFTSENFYENAIELNNNPIHCDCQIRSFLEYVKTRNEELKLLVFKMDQLYCNSPEFMKNKLVENLDISKLPCEQKDCVSECQCYKQFSSDYRIMECENFPNNSFADIVNEVYIRNGGSLNLSQFTSFNWESLNWITIQRLISTNVTTPVFSRMTNLTVVIMTNNVNLQFSETVFSHLRQLITLDLHSSELITLKNNSFRGDTELQSLDLSYNSLRTIPTNIFDDLCALQSLDLSNNNFTDLQTEWFKNLTKLKTLFLKHNYVRMLQKDILRNCNSLEVLDLSENLITTIQSEFIPFGIVRVDFSKNQLSTVESSWTSLRHVKTFNLSYNFIKDVNMSLLMEFPSFATILLQNNNISHVIWSGDKYFESDLNVNLGNNPFVCDCNLKHFVQMINKKNSTRLRRETIEKLYCFQPAELANVSLASLEKVNLYCEIEICPAGCDCKHYSNDEINVFDCVATIATDLRTCPNIVDELYLSGNTSTQHLQEECWKFLKKLHISDNVFFIANLSGVLLKNYGQLVELSLRANGIREIPSKIFQFNTKLQIVDLKNNMLQNLPLDLFKNLLNLKQIDVSGNQLEFVNWHIPLTLQSLNLAGNRIEGIDIPKLNNHYKLIMLNVSYNRLKEVPNKPADYLYHLKNLQILDLSYNEIFIECNNQFSFFPQSLESLNLSHNKINCTHFWSELHKPSARLRNFDLSGNPVENLRVNDFVFCNNSELVVDMRNCSLKYYSLNFTHVNNEMWNVFLSVDISNNNLIECDCNVRRFSELADILDNNLTLHLQLLSINTCDLAHFDVNVTLLSKFDFIPDDNYCTVIDNCSTHCICLHSDGITRMFCVGKSFISLPPVTPVNTQYLNMDYNELTVVEGLSRPDWQNLVTISLRHNRVTSVAKEDLSLLKYLQFIFLDGNQLHSPSGWLEYIVSENTLFFNLTLSSNPWACTCANDLFKKWVTRFSLTNQIPVILDGGVMFCADGNLFINIDLCPVDVMKIVLPIVAVSIILISMLTLTVVYYRKKMIIHAWCYSRNLCGCCVNEDEIDATKIYDGFISYCEEDAEYVSQELLPGLEEQQPFYKICIHHRDWTAGVPIVEQIESSIKNSRRVIIVLSRNFVNSPWANLEFRIANMQSIEDKINRVIAVTLDQDFLTDDLDPEFRAYLTTTTYLKADDAQFWNKLRYVMPHKRRVKKNLRHKAESSLELVEIAEDAV